jgi:hypothetical protein
MYIHFYIGANTHQSHGSVGLNSMHIVMQQDKHSSIPRIREIDEYALVFTMGQTFINPTDLWNRRMSTFMGSGTHILQSHGSVGLLNVQKISQRRL